MVVVLVPGALLVGGSADDARLVEQVHRRDGVLLQGRLDARVARAETLTIRNSDFIAAIRLQGAGPLRIVLGHVVPLCTSSLIVRVGHDMAGIILTAAGLGFLGLGAQPPAPEWGAMIASGRRFLLDQWWVATVPGIAILVVSLGFNLLGDGLRDVLDPKVG